MAVTTVPEKKKVVGPPGARQGIYTQARDPCFLLYICEIFIPRKVFQTYKTISLGNELLILSYWEEP